MPSLATAIENIFLGSFAWPKGKLELKDSLMEKLVDLQHGRIKVGSTVTDEELLLASLITPIFNVNPQCLNDSITYIEGLKTMQIWAIMSKPTLEL